jgi:hypothetical protein
MVRQKVHERQTVTKRLNVLPSDTVSLIFVGFLLFESFIIEYDTWIGLNKKEDFKKEIAMKGIIAGVIAGFAGAVVWALIAALTGFEIGWLAWGIGAAVGAAVAWGSEGTPAMGVVAVIISVLAIVAGKYITIEMLLAKEMDGANEQIAAQLEMDEYYISRLADAEIAQVEEAGGTVTWPEAADNEEAALPEQYPADIWAKAETVWTNMTPEDKDQFKQDVQQQVDENIAAFTAGVRKEGFLGSFGLFDAIFFFLAIGTAYKIGSKAD